MIIGSEAIRELNKRKTSFSFWFGDVLGLPNKNSAPLLIYLKSRRLNMYISCKQNNKSVKIFTAKLCIHILDLWLRQKETVGIGFKFYAANVTREIFIPPSTRFVGFISVNVSNLIENIHNDSWQVSFEQEMRLTFKWRCLISSNKLDKALKSKYIIQFLFLLTHLKYYSVKHIANGYCKWFGAAKN